MNVSLLHQAALDAIADQDFPLGTLYVLATPIGNLADLSLRAVGVLHGVDAIACEDTRHTRGLLNRLGLDGKPLLAVHEHNEHEAAQGIVERLRSGQRVAYVSDAGTPAISDPGAALVSHTQAAGLRCLPIPGPSAAVAAMSVAGDIHSQGFAFVGFLPSKSQARASAIESLARISADGRQAQVIYEAPHRIEALAQALADHWPPNQPVTICRELTKQFETVHTLSSQELPAWLRADPHRSKGEFALVLHAPAPVAAADSGQTPDDPRHDHVLRPLLKELPTKQAVAIACAITGEARNTLYERALFLKQEQ